MDSPFSDPRIVIAELREAARRGDWQTANQFAAILAQQPAPAAQETAAEYLRELTDAVHVAKASRAHLAASMVRFNAAAKFHRANSLSDSWRQYPGDPPDSCRIAGAASEPSQ